METKAKKRTAFAFVAIAHIVLAEIFHVMDIHSHIMTESVRHEESGNTAGYHLVNISHPPTTTATSRTSGATSTTISAMAAATRPR